MSSPVGSELIEMHNMKDTIWWLGDLSTYGLNSWFNVNMSASHSITNNLKLSPQKPHRWIKYEALKTAKKLVP